MGKKTGKIVKKKKVKWEKGKDKTRKTGKHKLGKKKWQNGKRGKTRGKQENRKGK